MNEDIDRTWPAVVGTALVTVAALLVGVAVVYLGASALSTGAGDGERVALFVATPLITAAAALGGAMALLSRARPKQWGRYVGLGFAIAAAVVLFFLFILPEIRYPDA